MSALSAVLIAGGATLVGVLLCAAGGDELTRTFSVFYLGGCILAALMVRYRGLFTAVVQPPLILFVGVPLAYQFMADEGGTSPKDIALNVAIPLVNRFPLMLLTTLVTLIIGGYRVYLKRSGPAIASEGRSRNKSAPRTESQPQTSAQPRTAARATAHTGSTGRSETTPRQRPETAANTRQRPDAPTQRLRPAPHSQLDSGNLPQRPAAPAQRQRQEPPTQRQQQMRPPTEQPNRNPQQRPASSEAVRMPGARSGSSDLPAHPMPQVRYRDREDMANEA